MGFPYRIPAGSCYSCKFFSRYGFDGTCYSSRGIIPIPEDKRCSGECSEYEKKEDCRNEH